MNFSYWCVLAAGMLPLLTVGIAKFRSSYDNDDPRGWLDKQDGMRKRADYAHRNHFEAFPFFAAAVIIAQQVHASQPAIDTLAGVFITARIAYTACYLFNRSSLRTAAFAVAFACVLCLFFLAARAS